MPALPEGSWVWESICRRRPEIHESIESDAFLVVHLLERLVFFCPQKSLGILGTDQLINLFQKYNQLIGIYNSTEASLTKINRPLGTIASGLAAGRKVTPYLYGPRSASCPQLAADPFAETGSKKFSTGACTCRGCGLRQAALRKTRPFTPTLPLAASGCFSIGRKSRDHVS